MANFCRGWLEQVSAVACACKVDEASNEGPRKECDTAFVSSSLRRVELLFACFLDPFLTLLHCLALESASCGDNGGESRGVTRLGLDMESTYKSILSSALLTYRKFLAEIGSLAHCNVRQRNSDCCYDDSLTHFYSTLVLHVFVRCRWHVLVGTRRFVLRRCSSLPSTPLAVPVRLLRARHFLLLSKTTRSDALKSSSAHRVR